MNKTAQAGLQESAALILLLNLLAHSLYLLCILKCQHILFECAAHAFHVPTKEEEEPDPGFCEDYDPKCEGWAKEGECEKNSIFMVTRKLLCPIAVPNRQVFNIKRNRALLFHPLFPTQNPLATYSQLTFPPGSHRIENITCLRH